MINYNSVTTIKKYLKNIFFKLFQDKQPSNLFLAGLLIICCFIPGLSFGEEIDLDQALSLFYKNNYDILINRYEIDKTQADFIGAKLLPNPNLSVNYTGLEPEIKRGDNSQLTLRIDQLIELGGKRGFRSKSAGETLEAAKLTHQDTIRTLLVGFYTNYYNLLLNDLNIDFAKEELKRFDRVIEIGGKRYQAGFLTLIDYTKLKVARIDLENNLTTNITQYQNNLETFNALLGGGGIYKPRGIQVKGDFPDYQVNPLIEKAYANRHDLLSLQRQIKASEYNQKLAKAQRIPDITLGVEYEGFGENLDPGLGAGISVGLPLFARGQGDILKRKAELNQLKLQIEKIKIQIQVDIKQGLNNYSSSIKIFDSYQTRKDEMDQLLSGSEKAFSLGGITVLDLLDTHKTYKDFITKYNQSFIQATLNKALLKLSKGEIQ
jgi:Outer membrane protein